MSAPMAPFVRAGVTLIARIPAIACACAFSPLKASRYAFSPRTTRKPSSPALRSSLGGLPSLWCALFPFSLACQNYLKPGCNLKEK